MSFAKGTCTVYASIFLMNRPRAFQTMLAHYQDEAHKLHERVQAQERHVRYPDAAVPDTGTDEISGARAPSVA